MSGRRVSEDDQLGLAAGDGLGASSALIDTLIAPLLSLPDVREDGFRLTQRTEPRVITSDVFSVDPLVFPGGDIGLLAATGACNDLLASGARITEVALGIFAAASLERSTLQRCLKSFAAPLSELGASVVCGDTKVHPYRQPELLLYVTALGVARSPHRFDMADTVTGDVIIVTGALGDHAIAVLSEREGLGFESVVRSDARPLNGPIEELIDAGLLHSIRDLTRGGLVAALWDGFRATGLTWSVRKERIPIHQPVRAAAEMLGLDVLTLTNEGCMLLTAPAEHGTQVIDTLRKWPETAEAEVIGRVTPAEDISGPQLISEHGGSRLIRMPSGIGIPRLC
ncbi:HypE family hydrogenase expression/formation protein [Micromonospora chersina]|uniref:HypE family hydrogenase expression/formation protein n=1 Tax=Micromonospora chersina TaxID=47854 RepID=UPI003D8CF8BB